jgi:hypothetical protein
MSAFFYCFPIFKVVISLIDIPGAKYELPKYVLSEPTNLIQDSWKAVMQKPNDVKKKCKGFQKLKQLQWPGTCAGLMKEFKHASVNSWPTFFVLLV